MPLTKELQQELEKFFDFKLWPAYPSDLCGSARKKGPKGEAKEKFLKIKNLDMDYAQKILDNILAQVRYDRREKSGGTEPARWPYLTTYIHQRRWDDELSEDGFERGDQKLSLGECKTEGCEQEVIGPRFKQCPDCYAKENDPWMEHRKRHLEEKGLLPHPGEAKRDYYGRLREWYREHLSADNIGKT